MILLCKHLLVAAALMGLTACSSMREKDGHTLFNPAYLFYLESRSRDQWQMPDDVLNTLQVREGEVVADIGAGGGYFTEKLAKRVGPSGRVYATDVQDIMIRKLNKRVVKRGLTNVTVIRAGFQDPMLPNASCDLAFFSSVYKEIDDRVAYMETLRQALKENGRVAILEYRPNEESPGPPKQYRLAEPAIIAEMNAAGYALAERHDFLPRECFLVFKVERQLGQSRNPSLPR